MPAAIVLLIAPAVILTVGHSLHAGGVNTLTAGCYEMTVEVFADALPSGTGAGSASSSCNVLLSPSS